MDVCGIAKYNIKSERQVFRRYVRCHSDTTISIQNEHWYQNILSVIILESSEIKLYIKIYETER